MYDTGLRLNNNWTDVLCDHQRDVCEAARVSAPFVLDAAAVIQPLRFQGCH